MDTFDFGTRQVGEEMEHVYIIKNVGSIDHMPFTSVGIPAFTFIQDPVDYESRTHTRTRTKARTYCPMT